jgi:hypothetical protein
MPTYGCLLPGEDTSFQFCDRDRDRDRDSGCRRRRET